MEKEKFEIPRVLIWAYFWAYIGLIMNIPVIPKAIMGICGTILIVQWSFYVLVPYMAKINARLYGVADRIRERSNKK